MPTWRPATAAAFPTWTARPAAGTRPCSTSPTARTGTVRRLNRSGATLTPVRAVEATELIACDVFRIGGRQITLGDVERYLWQLRGHVPDCGCDRCEAAAMVRADRVLMIVRAWQRQLAATRVRALR
jgi:hypothetical protein